MNPENLEIAQAYDSALLAANFTKTLDAFDLDNEEQIQNIALLIEKLDKQIRSTPDCDELRFWKLGLIGLQILQIEFRLQKMATNASGDILAERERISILWTKLNKEVSKLPGENNRIWSKKSSSEVNNDEDVEELVLFLKALPLPTIYFRKKENGRKQTHEKGKVQDDEISPLIRLIAYIDTTPLLTPQLLHPQLLYSLKFVVCVT